MKKTTVISLFLSEKKYLIFNKKISTDSFNFFVTKYIIKKNILDNMCDRYGCEKGEINIKKRMERITKLQKNEILAGSIHRGGGKLAESHFSSGSTVTRNGLEYACLVNKIPLIGEENKKNYLRIMLEYVDDNLQKKDKTYIKNFTSVELKRFKKDINYLTKTIGIEYEN